MGVCNTNNDPSNITHRLRRVRERLLLAPHPGWHDAKGTR